MAALVALPALAGSAQASAKTSVYTLSNQPSGNQVLRFDRAPDGSLTQTGAFATTGLGTGAGLGSQNAVIVTADRKFLVAVNPGSNSVSAFRFGPNGPKLLNTVPSGGTTPISVTAHDGVVYVLNAGSLNIAGYTLGRHGLSVLVDSVHGLSPAASGPAQVSFDPSGSALVVSEKTSNSFDVFTVTGGSVSTPTMYPSAGGVPFGFAFDRAGHLLAAQANAGVGESAASSYAVGPGGAFATIAGPVLTHQGAACWLAVSNDGRFAFTANAGSGSISSFSIAADGTPTLLGSTLVAVGSHPLDEAVGGTTLFVLADELHQLASYRIGKDGSLSALGGASGLPVGTMGLATRCTTVELHLTRSSPSRPAGGSSEPSAFGPGSTALAASCTVDAWQGHGRSPPAPTHPSSSACAAATRRPSASSPASSTRPCSGSRCSWCRSRRRPRRPCATAGRVRSPGSTGSTARPPCGSSSPATSSGRPGTRRSGTAATSRSAPSARRDSYRRRPWTLPASAMATTRATPAAGAPFPSAGRRSTPPAPAPSWPGPSTSCRRRSGRSWRCVTCTVGAARRSRPPST